MATGGLYGNSGTGALIAQPGAETPGLYGKSPNGSVVAQPGSESAGLYGNGTTFGGYYFEWFVFQTSATQPATPTGGSWNFQTDSGTAPSGWTNAPASNPTNPVWISIALVNSRSTSPLVWSTPGVLSYSGTINGSGAPTSGIGQIGELYIQTGVTPNALWFKSGSTTWTQITGSALYVDLTSSQTIAGTKTFSSTIQGNISGNAGTVTNGVYTNGTYVDPSWIASLAGSKITGNISGNAANVTGTVAIVNGGTGATTASGARTNLGLGTIATQDASSVAITGGSITGITDLAIADGGTGASTAGQARTNLGLGQGEFQLAHVASPQLIQGLYCIEQIATGSGHTLALDMAKKVYAWGNPENGAIGPTYLSSTCLPVELSILGKLIQQVACGADHSCFLTQDNQVYTCGKGDKGQLGIGYPTSREFRPLPMHSKHLNTETCQIDQIQCSDYQTIVITRQ